MKLRNSNFYLFSLDEWRNDKTMSELMYDFRPRELDSERYDFKMTFWKEMIENYCEFKGTPSFTVKELKEVFNRKGTSPYCIKDVVNQMIIESNIQDKESFMSSPKSWGEWTFGILVTPMTWSFNKLKEKVTGSSGDAEKVFVCKKVLIHQAKILQDHVRNAHSYNNIVSMEELMKSSEDIDGLSRDGILMTLQYLSAVEKSVYIEESKGEENSQYHKLLMKFSEPYQMVPITQLERSVYNLETTEKFLLSAIDKKEHQLNEVLNNVKTCLKDGKKQMAKTHLKKKHMLENDITKTMTILENIQAMLLRVHNSKSDKEILQTYKMGAEGIKSIFAESGVSIDNVFDVIEGKLFFIQIYFWLYYNIITLLDMKDVLGDQDELQNIISTPLRGNEEIDDAELEAELKELISDEKNNGGGKIIQKPEQVDLNLIDLEMRLKRLRGDLPDLDEEVAAGPFFKTPKTTITQ